MKQYKLLISKELNKLEDDVTQKLESGWKLYGNPIITKNYSFVIYGQAMTLELGSEHLPE